MEHRRWNEHGRAEWTGAARPLGPHTQAQTVGHGGPERGALRGALGWTLCSPGPQGPQGQLASPAANPRRTPSLTRHSPLMHKPQVSPTPAWLQPLPRQGPAGPSSADAQAPGPPALQALAAPAPVCPALGPAGGPLLWTPLSCPSRGGWVVDSPSHQPEWVPEWVPPPPRRMLCPQGHRALAGPWSLRRSPDRKSVV